MNPKQSTHELKPSGTHLIQHHKIMDQQSIQQCRLDAAGLPVGYDFQADWELTSRLVKTMLEGDDDLVLLDCRTEQEHRIARIAGSLLIPLQKIVARTVTTVDSRFRRWPSFGNRVLQAFTRWLAGSTYGLLTSIPTRQDIERS